jgi:uracil-DNA glycosylase family 4
MPCPYRTSFCPEGKEPVPGEGRLDSKLVLIGEAPGGQENRLGRPFIGKTGKELDQTYLPRAGQMREWVYITNTVKCHVADSGKAPSAELAAHCAKHVLSKELRRINPRHVVLMGGTACSLLGPDFDLEMDHGFPRRAALPGWTGPVYPTYHPALGIHKSSAMRDLLADFAGIREWLAGRFTFPVDEYPSPDYRRLTDPEEVRLILDGRYDDWLATDTESKWTPHGYEPWCAQFSVDPGTGYLIRVDDEDAWNEYLLHLVQFRHIVMHNAIHDMETYRRAGIQLDWGCVHDTMQRAYHVGMPQGLKVLGHRLLGVKMRTFDEVTRPYATERAMEYILEADTIDWGKPDAVEIGGTVVRNCKTCKGKGKIPIRRGSRLKLKCKECRGAGKVEIPRVYQPQGLNQKFSRLTGDLCRGDVNIWERWDNWGEQTAPVVERMGPLPRPCITLVPEDEAVEYASRDADITLRVYPILRRMAAEIRRRVRER